MRRIRKGHTVLTRFGEGTVSSIESDGTLKIAMESGGIAYMQPKHVMIKDLIVATPNGIGKCHCMQPDGSVIVNMKSCEIAHMPREHVFEYSKFDVRNARKIFPIYIQQGYRFSYVMDLEISEGKLGAQRWLKISIPILAHGISLHAQGIATYARLAIHGGTGNIHEPEEHSKNGEWKHSEEYNCSVSVSRGGVLLTLSNLQILENEACADVCVEYHEQPSEEMSFQIAIFLTSQQSDAYISVPYRFTLERSKHYFEEFTVRVAPPSTQDTIFWHYSHGFWESNDLPHMEGCQTEVVELRIPQDSKKCEKLLTAKGHDLFVEGTVELDESSKGVTMVAGEPSRQDVRLYLGDDAWWYQPSSSFELKVDLKPNEDLSVVRVIFKLTILPNDPNDPNNTQVIRLEADCTEKEEQLREAQKWCEAEKLREGQQ